MKRDIYTLTASGLLHDIGKVIFRAGIIDGRSHSISGAELISEISKEKELVQCIRYHHKKELANTQLNNDSLSYITYIADNISAGSDRRDNEIEGISNKFQKYMPLSSVFNILNQNNANTVYKNKRVDQIINYPIDIDHQTSATDYNKIYQDIRLNLKNIEFTNTYINSLLEIMETYLSFVPSSTMTNQVADISLYDHSKTTAAISNCIYYYLAEHGIEDYKEELLKKELQFYEKDAFLLFSIDFSGIQQFIYNVISKGALKSLRARSFYLEMLLEHIVDEILSELQLPRTNLLYTGGGHSYMLLPNTEDCRNTLDRFKKSINEWLIEHFGVNLYYASAYESCSANDLMKNVNKVYSNVSRKLSELKLSRYNIKDIQKLNREPTLKDGRECKICGTTSKLDKEDICNICESFTNISNEILKEDVIIFTTINSIKDVFNIEVPGLNEAKYLNFTTEQVTKNLLKDTDNIIRIYSKNKTYTGLNYATKIWQGDYSPYLTLGELADKSVGIKRLAVLRADVDNLGMAFTKGFKEPYNTLSRTITLSRHLSMFFKYNINQIMKGDFDQEQFSLLGNKTENKKRNLAIVYSGGDDIFIVGAWNEIIEVAIDIQEAFSKYSVNSLTISAGIGIFHDKYPVYEMAYDTAELEEKSKEYKDGEKNAITLFTTHEGHTYNWTEFKEGVIGQKLKLLLEFFASDERGIERGKTFLYKLLSYIREASKDSINIARYAYILARLEPKKTSPTYKIYKIMSSKMYEWLLSDKDRQELITAIYICVYLLRERDVK